VGGCVCHLLNRANGRLRSFKRNADFVDRAIQEPSLRSDWLGAQLLRADHRRLGLEDVVRGQVGAGGKEDAGSPAQKPGQGGPQGAAIDIAAVAGAAEQAFELVGGLADVDHAAVGRILRHRELLNTRAARRDEQRI
jgi:hypothetical protein